ncbi:hypothetical protein SEPCBS57363_006348 [Sporothrix epigloea]|uniref:J domain-containing protein n=1 Tax=Sporothrix epigloea TaxID=1892477 RepID=A0ABP0E4I7_9PEZI
MPEQTAYSFFGIAPTASPFEIQEAYRRLARKYPADRVWDTPMASVAKTGRHEVERWYTKISSPEARRVYDAMLAAERLSVAVHSGADCSKMEERVDLKSDIGDLPWTEALVDRGDKPLETGSVDEQRVAFIGLNIKDRNINKSEEEEDEGMIVTRGVREASVRRVPGRKALFALVLLLMSLMLTIVIQRLVLSGVNVSSPYRVLGLPEDHKLNNTVIRSAYYRAILVHHPDKQPGHRESRTDIVKVAEAYKTLTDPYQRCLYEEKRGSWWDPVHAVHERLCDHLQPGNEGEEIVNEDDKLAVNDAISSTRPSQLAVYCTLHMVQLVRRIVGDLVAWLVRWPRQR